jgi:acyl-CoA dehydrogenase
MWDFETDQNFQRQLDWTDEFVREKVEPLDHLIAWPYAMDDPVRRALIPPLQDEVRAAGLWACHLGPELRGPGYGQLKLALLNEILGRSACAPTVFGSQAPDSGNAEILAHFGTEFHKRTYLEPLLRNEVVSAFSMTEPQGGADPTQFTLRAEPDGTGWRLTGEKWFTSNARYASFFIVVAVTDPGAAPSRRTSMFVVPADAPGIEIVRDVGVADEPLGKGAHAYVRYRGVWADADSMLGGRGDGFVVAQTRLAGGRIHHSMRTVGLAQRALDMMCERARSRHTKGELLGDKQLVQAMIADSWIELEQFRLLVLRTAWRIDRYNDYRKVRGDIAAVKVAMPKVLHDIAARAVQIHGSLGISNELPLGRMVMESFSMGLADGPTEVHKMTLARVVLAGATPSPGPFPTQHLPALRAAAQETYCEQLDGLDANLTPSGAR